MIEDQPICDDHPAFWGNGVEPGRVPLAVELSQPGGRPALGQSCALALRAATIAETQVVDSTCSRTEGGGHLPALLHTYHHAAAAAARSGSDVIVADRPIGTTSTRTTRVNRSPSYGFDIDIDIGELTPSEALAALGVGLGP